MGIALRRKENFSSYCTHYQNSAFTLAEVLITLGIIGVVAAITMPTLIQNYQKQVYVTGIKKGISVFQNMIKKMQADEEASSIGTIKIFSEGVCESDDESCEYPWMGNPSVFEDIIPKYLNVVKICKNEECNRCTNASIRCNSNNVCTYWKGDTDEPIHYILASILAISSSDTENTTRGFYTSDGMIFYFAPFGSTPSIAVAIDINGDKGPNTIGRDIVSFAFFKSNGKFYDNASGIVEHLMSNGWNMDY